MHALAIALGGKSGAHLRTHPVKFPARLTSLSRNDTLCANLLADVPVVALAVKLGIGQNGYNAVACKNVIEERSQGSAVINAPLLSMQRPVTGTMDINTPEPQQIKTHQQRSYTID